MLALQVADVSQLGSVDSLILSGINTAPLDLSALGTVRVLNLAGFVFCEACYFFWHTLLFWLLIAPASAS